MDFIIELKESIFKNCEPALKQPLKFGIATILVIVSEWL